MAWYVGKTVKSGTRIAFNTSNSEPDIETWGGLFRLLEGPFETARAAAYFAEVWNSGGQCTQSHAEEFTRNRVCPECGEEDAIEDNGAGRGNRTFLCKRVLDPAICGHTWDDNDGYIAPRPLNPNLEKLLPLLAMAPGTEVTAQIEHDADGRMRVVNIERQIKNTAQNEALFQRDMHTYNLEVGWLSTHSPFATSDEYRAEVKRRDPALHDKLVALVQAARDFRVAYRAAGFPEQP